MLNSKKLKVNLFVSNYLPYTFEFVTMIMISDKISCSWSVLLLRPSQFNPKIPSPSLKICMYIRINNKCFFLVTCTLHLHTTSPIYVHTYKNSKERRSRSSRCTPLDGASLSIQTDSLRIPICPLAYYILNSELRSLLLKECIMKWRKGTAAQDKVHLFFSSTI
jgi:hypothetical protein